MTKIIVYFDESCIFKNNKKDYFEILYNSSKVNSPRSINEINLLIDKYATEIRKIVWDLYSHDTIKCLNNSFNSKINWINKKLQLAIIFSRFNSGISFNTDIGNLIKIISIVYWVKKEKIDEICFYGFDMMWQESVKVLFKNLDTNPKISFNNCQKIKFYKRFNFNFFIGLASIFKYSLKLIKNISYKSKQRNIINSDYIFVDYLFNFNKSLMSQYWSELPEILSKEHKVNIWHIYVPSPLTPSISHAAKLIKKLNSRSSKNINHQLIDLEMSFKDLVPATLEYLIIFTYFAFNKFNSKIYPLIKNDYIRSFFSGELLTALLMRRVFKRMAPKNLSKTIIVYVGENQTWEKSLADVALERKCNYSIFSVQTTLRYWDMRMYHPYITSKKFPNEKKIYNFPSLFACNSIYSFNELSNRMPNNYLKVVESLRQKISITKQKKLLSDQREPYIWFIGEYVESKTHQIYDILRKSKIKNYPYKMMFKPHPSDVGNFYRKYKKNFDNLKNIVNYQKGDLIIGDGTSTFLIESFLKGWKVIAFRSKCSINLSSFYMTDFQPPFFSSTKELDKIIANIKNYKYKLDILKINEIFEPNQDFKKWLSVLDIKKINEF